MARSSAVCGGQTQGWIARWAAGLRAPRCQSRQVKGGQSGPGRESRSTGFRPRHTTPSFRSRCRSQSTPHANCCTWLLPASCFLHVLLDPSQHSSEPVLPPEAPQPPKLPLPERLGSQKAEHDAFLGHHRVPFLCHMLEFCTKHILPGGSGTQLTPASCGSFAALMGELHSSC